MTRLQPLSRTRLGDVKNRMISRGGQRRQKQRCGSSSSASTFWPKIQTIIKLHLLGAAVVLLRQSSDHSKIMMSSYYYYTARHLSSSAAEEEASLPYPLSQFPALPITADNTNNSSSYSSPTLRTSSNTNSYLIPIPPHPNQQQQQEQQDQTTSSIITMVKPKTNDLRLDWSNLPLLSPLSKRIRDSQLSCPSFQDEADDVKYWIHQCKRNGLGQMLHQWSQSICNAMQTNRRVLTRGTFVWMHDSCQPSLDAKNLHRNYSASPFECYWGNQHEFQQSTPCPNRPTFTTSLRGSTATTSTDGGMNYIPMPTSMNDTTLVTNTTQVIAEKACDELLERDNITVSEFRAASMEWLFSSVTPLVIENAKQQLRGAFGKEGLPLDRNHMVTVHIRWGDKAKEMKLKPIQDYINAVHELVGKDKTMNTSYPLWVYVSSEDVNARTQFRQQAPQHWIVRSSGPHVLNRRPEIRQNASGKKGLQSLGALLLSMESNYYVLTTKSNWSRLINELRLNVINPRCNNCTKMIDLIYGEW